MAEPTITELFGANAAQTLDELIIDKSDLPGITPDVNNNPESLLVSLLLLTQTYLNQTNFDANLDQSILIESGLSSFLTRGPDDTNYRTDQINITLAKVDTNSTITPTDY